MKTKNESSSLFGLNNSNRDFSQSTCWGKNQFNSSFPAALACYMDSINIKPVYIKLNTDLGIVHDEISVEEVYGIKPLSSDLYFSFESDFSPYRPYAVGILPRIDLVTMNISISPYDFLCGIEIKLTALPDNQTCELEEDRYGSEIVVRPDTIVYLALSIAMTYKDHKERLKEFLHPVLGMDIDWQSEEEVAPRVSDIISCLDAALVNKISSQSSFLLQPIWKTIGKTLKLADDCYDIFIWSDFAFTRLFVDQARQQNRKDNLTRHMRTVVWLAKMLYEFTVKGKINHQFIIDLLTYNTKNDKAFACGGQITNPFMRCPNLRKPRILKEATREIILGGGEKFLSPERRLDSAILNTFGTL